MSETTAAVSTSTPEPAYAAFVAIDWADRKHVWALRQAGSSKIEHGELEHTPEAIDVWASELAARFPGRRVAIAVEQSKGGLVYALAKYPHLVLYPVHPGSLAKFREAFYPSGCKDDPVDTELLLEMLIDHRKRLRRLETDTLETRMLQGLVERRRKLVDQRTAFSNQLKSELKLYYPQVLDWFDTLYSAAACAFLLRWPRLSAVQRESEEDLRNFFHQHNCRGERVQQRLAQIRKAVPLTQDEAIVHPAELTVQALARQIQVQQQAIEELEKEIERRTVSHPDFPIFDSLPAAGKALAPRLIVAFGSRRARYESAFEIQTYSGIAPITIRSGKSQVVQFRWACPKFVRQTFHEWAALTIQWSEWAREFYEGKRAKGKDHHAAVRALAYKWLRIVFRCWKDHKPYDETRYRTNLRHRNSPVGSVVDLQWKNDTGFYRPFFGSAV